MNTNNNKLIVEEISPKEFYSMATICSSYITNEITSNDVNIKETSYINIEQKTCLLSFIFIKNEQQHIVEIKIKNNNTATLYQKVIYETKIDTIKHKTTFNDNDDYISMLFDNIELILMKNDESGFLALEKLKTKTFYSTKIPFKYSKYKERIVCDFVLHISGKALFDMNVNKNYDISEISKNILHDNTYVSNNFEYAKRFLRLKLEDCVYCYAQVSRTETSNKKYIIEKYLGLSSNNSIIYIVYSENNIDILKADDNSAYIFTIYNSIFNYKDKLKTETPLLPQILKNCICCEDVLLKEKHKSQFNEYFCKCVDKCMNEIKEHLKLNSCKNYALSRFIDKIASEKHIINNPYKNKYEIMSHKDLSCTKVVKEINNHCDFDLKGLFYNSFLRAYKYKITFTDDQYYKHYVTLNIETTMHEPSNTKELSTETDVIKFMIHVSEAEEIKRLFYEHTLAPEEFDVNFYNQ